MTKLYRYALCVENRGYTAALEVRKVYRMLADPTAKKRGMVRVVDESGEDYLYPARCFVPIEVPRGAVRVFPKKSA